MRAVNNGHWTDAEVAVLIRQANTSTAEEISWLLGRTDRSVRAKARSLGIQTKLNERAPACVKLSAIIYRYLDSERGRLDRKAYAMATDAPSVPYRLQPNHILEIG